jgi:uncharacterized alkaline shock family protein YloU
MDGSGDAHVTEVALAQAIVAAVRLVPGVADVSSGRFAEVATYGPNEKVRGVSVRATADGLDVEVHVCAHYADSLVLDDLAAQIRMAARKSIESSGDVRIARLDVAVDDLYVQ